MLPWKQDSLTWFCNHWFFQEDTAPWLKYPSYFCQELHTVLCCTAWNHAREDYVKTGLPVSRCEERGRWYNFTHVHTQLDTPVPPPSPLMLVCNSNNWLKTPIIEAQPGCITFPAVLPSVRASSRCCQCSECWLPKWEGVGSHSSRTLSLLRKQWKIKLILTLRQLVNVFHRDTTISSHQRLDFIHQILEGFDRRGAVPDDGHTLARSDSVLPHFSSSKPGSGWERNRAGERVEGWVPGTERTSVDCDVIGWVVLINGDNVLEAGSTKFPQAVR